MLFCSQSHVCKNYNNPELFKGQPNPNPCMSRQVGRHPMQGRMNNPFISAETTSFSNGGGGGAPGDSHGGGGGDTHRDLSPPAREYD